LQSSAKQQFSNIVVLILREIVRAIAVSFSERDQPGESASLESAG
jgi:hypothetical protein